MREHVIDHRTFDRNYLDSRVRTTVALLSVLQSSLPPMHINRPRLNGAVDVAGVDDRDKIGGGSNGRLVYSSSLLRSNYTRRHAEQIAEVAS